MVISEAQMELLEDLVGVEGHLTTVVGEALELNRATKILYLQRAISQSCAEFNISLDELNEFYVKKAAADEAKASYDKKLKPNDERLDVIRSLKAINDLYHNNEVAYKADAPMPDDFPSYLDTGYKATRKVLNHTFGFVFRQEIRFSDATAEALKTAFQPVIYQKIQKEIVSLYKTFSDKDRNFKIFVTKRKQQLLEAHKIKANPDWRKELSLPKDQLLKSQRDERVCTCGGHICSNINARILVSILTNLYGMGRAGDEHRGNRPPL